MNPLPLILLVALSAVAHARVAQSHDLEAELRREILERRQDTKCDYETACRCIGITREVSSIEDNPGFLFCGDNAFNCKQGYVYQCDRTGNLSNVCEYGTSTVCARCKGIYC